MSASATQGGHNNTLFYRIMSSHFIWNAYFKSGNLDKGDAILAYYENSAWGKKIGNHCSVEYSP